MPIVKIDYAPEKFEDEAIQKLCEFIRPALAEIVALPLEDVVVYANKNQITAGAYPLEIYVYGGPGVVADAAAVQKALDALKEKLVAYKAEQGIAIPFNVTIAKMEWKVAIEI
ncbi:MAG: hypothetical protein AAB955_00710 [Patescibacteria group bacterium]